MGDAEHGQQRGGLLGGEEPVGAGERGVEQQELVEAALPYMNRLSDLLFTLARAVNAEEGRPEARWLPMRQREEAASGAPDFETDD